MPPSEDLTGESLPGLVLQLRGRTGLTQYELAARVGVSVGSIQGWEAGDNYPGVASLKALIAAGLQAGGFAAGREREEAQALWATALRDAPRFRTPFDGAWFDQIVAEQRSSFQSETERTVAVRPSPPIRTTSTRRESWGEAPDIAGFLNRASEREMLRQWVLDEGSRVVAVLGLGGIGKSLLATRLAQDVAPSFERIFWRSLRDAPTPRECLAEALSFLAPDDAREAGGEAALLRRLLELFSQTRCLLVLDNLETVLQTGGRAGDYRASYEGYGTLLRQLGEAPHQSCLVVTSREEPSELGLLRGAHGPVRALDLGGLDVDDGRALLRDKRLEGDAAAWQALIQRYGGNGLALKVVGEATREMFGGSIAEYLAYATATPGVMVRGVRQLLGAQIQRLSGPEHELLCRLAVAREPVGIADLAADLGPRIGRIAMLEAVEGLRRRSLLERTERGPFFGLHSVVLEYVTDELIEDVAHELAVGEPVRVLRQPLVKATGKDHVRRSQDRLIAAPIVERLVTTCRSAQAADQRLLDLLDAQRGRPFDDQGYGPGNLVNLLRLLRGDLKGVDLSGLSIRQAYLQDVEAQGASLAGARLSEVVLGEQSDYPGRVALSADGTIVAAGTSTGEVCIWRVADRTLLAALRGHSSGILGVAVNADGSLVTAVGYDGIVRVWDVPAGRLVFRAADHSGPVYSVALTADGRFVASGSTDQTVKLWELASGRLVATLEGHQGGVRGVALSPDGGLVASGGYDETVRLWDGSSGRLLRTLRGHAGGVWGVALSGDGRLVASGGHDGTVRLWQADDGAPLAVLRGHAGQVWGVALSGDGRRVASGGADGVVRTWDTAGRGPLATMRGHSGQVWGVALSRDGQWVASGSEDGTLRLWDSSIGQPRATWRGQTDGVWGVAMSADDRLVLSGSHDGTIRFWEVASGRLLQRLRGHAAGVWAVALSADGRIAASASHDETVRLWDVERGQLITTLRGHTGGVWSVALHEDGRLVASGGIDGTIRLWDAVTGRQLMVLEAHAGGVRCVGISADGSLAATCGFDGTVRLWETESGRLVATLEGHQGGIRGVVLSPDGRLVVSGGFDGTVRLWDVASNRPPTVLDAQRGGVWSVALRRDGSWVAGGGYDGTVQIWEMATGRLVQTLRGHRGGIWGVALSAGGDLAVSGGIDGEVRLWTVGSGECLRVLRDERRYERLDITGLTGVTEAQRAALLTLGAIERRGSTTPSA
ncbi:MAG TPA: helix-turn-helix domain-containing protein [Chloroflexota bacterium]|nr:helix-turn-helix domain-containing protein [Chloroflexota bacterium]